MLNRTRPPTSMVEFAVRNAALPDDRLAEWSGIHIIGGIAFSVGSLRLEPPALEKKGVGAAHSSASNRRNVLGAHGRQVVVYAHDPVLEQQPAAY